MTFKKRILEKVWTKRLVTLSHRGKEHIPFQIPTLWRSKDYEEEGVGECLRQTLQRIKVSWDFFVFFLFFYTSISLPPHPLFCLSSEPKLSPSILLRPQTMATKFSFLRDATIYTIYHLLFMWNNRTHTQLTTKTFS